VYILILFYFKFASDNKDDFLYYLKLQNNNNLFNNSNNNSHLDLNSEIKNLKNELKEKNKLIKQKDLIIMDLQNQLNNINNSNNNNLSLIKNLQNNLNIKEQELNQLKNNLNSNQYKTYNDKKWGFAISFRSNDQTINYPMVCNENDTISRLEEELYNEFPKYKDYNTYLTCNGVILKRFKTIGENNIKKGDAILVNIYQ